ncbi:MAG: HXXEE domain-containing protein [Pseudomonadota bacterium]
MGDFGLTSGDPDQSPDDLAHVVRTAEARVNQPLAAISLILFFMVVWLPLGQHAFLTEHWMKVGAFIAPLVLFFGFKARNHKVTPWTGDIMLMACLFTAAYLLHQVEEHWIDLLGRTFPLHETLNRLLASMFGPEAYGLLTKTGLFLINAGMVWLAGFLAILMSPQRVFPALAMAGLMFVNAIGHTVNAIVAYEYNSGLATSIILFLPLSLLFFRTMLHRKQASVKLILLAIAWGFLGHVLLFGGLYATTLTAAFSIEGLYALLFIWGALPTVVSLQSPTAKS